MAQKLPALAGFTAGIVLTLAAGAFGTVMFSGAGISDNPSGAAQVIYPDL